MRTLMHFRDFVNEIMESNSRLHKQEVLRKYADDDVVGRYLQIAFDPYKVYGISTKKLYANVPPHVVADIELFSIFELFEYLEEHNTGTFTEIMLCQNLLDGVAAIDQECAELLEKLICKDLSIGCDAKTINKEIPGLIPTFDVQLAQKYFERPEKLEGKEFAVTTKIDGGRIIAIKENGQVSFFTRAGQRYEGLVDLEREMLESLPDGIVLDGEITLYNTHGISSKEAYKQAMKVTRKDGEKHGVKMLVFDGMPVEDFRKQQCQYTWAERRQELENIFVDGPGRWLGYFELLPVLYRGTDASMVTKLLNEAIAAQQEGVMLNLVDEPYQFSRTWSLMKVKKMQTMDLEIIGFEEGEGRLAGTLGAILVRYKNGNIVKVGSGFSDDIREQIWEHQLHYSGKIVEIQYFEETTNADGGESLRFPIFKDFRPDKTEADY